MDALDTSFAKLQNSEQSVMRTGQQMAASLKNLNNEQLVAKLTSSQYASEIDKFSVAQLKSILTVSGVEKAQAQELATKLKLLAAKQLNRELTNEEALAYDKLKNSMDSKSLTEGLDKSRPAGVGKAMGTTIGMAAVTQIFNIMSSYSSAKSAETAGKAVGSSLATGVSSALMAGLSVGMINPIAGLAVGLGSLAISGISALVGWNDGETQRIDASISKSKELIKAYKEQQNALENTATSAKDLVEEYAVLSRGVDSNGRNVSLAANEYNRYKDITNELASQYDSLLRRYNAEGVAILSLTGNIADMNSAMEVAIERAQELSDLKFVSNDAKDITEGYVNDIKDLYSDLDKIQSSKGQNSYYQGMFGLGNEEKKYKGLIKLLDEYNIKYTEGTKRGGGDIPMYYWTITVDEKDFDNAIEKVQRQIEDKIRAANEEYSLIVQPYLRLNADYNNFDSEIKDFIHAIIPTINWDEMNIVNPEDIRDYVVKNIIDPIAKLSPSDKQVFQNAINELLKIDASKLSVTELESQVKEVMSKIQSVLNLSDEEVISITTKFGFNIDKIDNIQKLIDEALGLSQEEIDQGIHFPITIELTNNLKIDELAQMQRYISEAKDEIEAMARAESLSKIFTPDNEKFLKNVRSIQSEYNNEKISIIDANNAIEDSFHKAFAESTPEDLATFMEFFKLVPQTVTDGVKETTTQIGSLIDNFNQLGEIIKRIKSGEKISGKDLLDLIDKFPELIDSLKVDAEGVAFIPVDAIESQQNQLNQILQNGIAKRIAFYEFELSKLGGRTKENAEQFDELKRQLEQLSNLQGIDLSKFLQQDTNLVASFNKTFDDLTKSSSNFNKSVNFNTLKSELDALKKKAEDTLDPKDILNYQNALKKFNEITFGLDEISSYISDVKVLGEVWAAFRENSVITADSQIKLQQNLRATTDQIQELNKAAQSGNKQEVLRVLDDITTAYINQRLATGTLTKEMVDQLAAELKLHGVKVDLTNINYKLATAQFVAAINSNTLTNGIKESAKAAFEAIGAIEQYNKVLSALAAYEATKGSSVEQYTKHALDNALNEATNAVDTPVEFDTGKWNKDSKKDSHKEAFEEWYKRKKHLVDTDEETEENFINELDIKYKEFFANRKKYVDDFEKYEKEVFDGRRKLAQDYLKEQEHEVFKLSKHKGTEHEQISIFKGLQDKLVQMGQDYRLINSDENSEYLQELRTQYWKYFDDVEKLYNQLYDKEHTLRGNNLKLLDYQFGVSEGNVDNTAMTDNLKKQIEINKQIMDAAVEEGKRLRQSPDVDEFGSEMSAQRDIYWNALNENVAKQKQIFEIELSQFDNYIKERNKLNNWGTDSEIAALQRRQAYIEESFKAGQITREEYLKSLEESENRIVEYYDTILAKAHGTLDNIQNVYDTLKNAAKEFSESGFITVDTFQQIADLGVEYLAYLIDENNQLDKYRLTNVNPEAQGCRVA